nr:hypothetical protein [Sphingomonadaceae bacterium]
ILRMNVRRGASGEVARARAARVRTMDDHFSELFASYEAIVAGSRAAA